MTQIKKYSVLYFYKVSEGELHVALPLLKAIMDRYSNIDIYFAFNDKSSYEGIGEINRLIIDDLGSTIIGNKEYHTYLRNNHDRGTLVMTCDSGLREWSQLALKVISRNKVLFHTPAYALRGKYKLDDPVVNSQNAYKKHIFEHIDRNKIFLVLNSNYDIEHYCAGGFVKESMLLAGAPGYTSWWLDYLIEMSKKGEKFKATADRIGNKNYKAVIFVPTRGKDRNEALITEENYRYQTDSVFWLAENNPGYLFLLKPHPRQKDIALLAEKCRSNKYGNIIMVNDSTILLSKYSDLTVSFWSSAIQDSLSVGTPVIEFHRHQNEHYNLVRKTNGELVSLYHDLGFCPHYTNKEDVHDLLANKKEWKAMFGKARKCFEEYFPVDEKTNSDFLDKIGNLLKDMDRKPGNSLKSVMAMNSYFLKCRIKGNYNP